MGKPHYFIAVFGELEEGKDTVESGVYKPNPKHPPRATSGDILLLYCTANYPDYHMESPGLGIVLKPGPDRIEYRWLPLVDAIPRESIKATLDSHVAERFSQLHFGGNWLIEISPESFSEILSNRAIAWGKL